MLAAGVFAAGAAEATFDFTKLYGPDNNTELTDQTIDGVTMSISSEGASTKAQYYKTGTALRLYAKNTMTISVPSGSTITGVAYTLRDASYNHGDDDSFYMVDNGTFTADFEGYTASWTGSSESFTLTISEERNSAGKNVQLHIRSMVVTYTMGEQTKVTAPKFDLAEGKYYSAQEVGMTCGTEGATILYSIAGKSEGTVYMAPIQLTEVGTYTISAYAVKDGLENSDVVTATYEIANPTEVGSIEEFIMEGEGTPDGVYKWTFPVTVTAQPAGSGYTYVVDNAGSAMLIYGNDVPAYNVGDVIPAGVTGSFVNYRGLYEMQYPDASTFAVSTENKGYTAPRMKAGEITTADMNKVVIIENATYTIKEGDKYGNGTFTDESGSITVYPQSRFNTTLGESGKAYDILCAVGNYNGNVQVHPLEFMEAGSGVNDAVADATSVRAIEGAVVVTAEGNATIYNAAGQIVESQAVNGEATIAVAPGFYIVRAGQTVAKVIVR